ncbi:hypothetical protein VB638_00460 [Dolichospermum sp. UHCC 0684]|nr:hypothetical protein [Dolichospermum sp. UHCC 0260]MEA5528078.1 hypothetical protein [Dolichospermum sp. UHCC 0684]
MRARSQESGVRSQEEELEEEKNSIEFGQVIGFTVTYTAGRKK